MMAVNRVVEGMPVDAARLDPESAEWLRVLGRGGPQREVALARMCHYRQRGYAFT
jgi:hypothetical protein